MPTLADVFVPHAQPDARPDLVARGCGGEELAAAEIAPQLRHGEKCGEHHGADVQHTGAVHVVELEALHLRAVRERGVRRGEPFNRSPHAARCVSIHAEERAAEDAAPLELGAVERAAERVEDQELQPLADLRGNGFVAQPGGEFGQATGIGIHSMRMPAARTTLPTRAISALMCAANSSGVLPIGSAPSAARRLDTSGCLSALTLAPCSRSITSRGVPAGARLP